MASGMEKVFDRLVLLAGGDIGVVSNAIRTVAKPDGRSELADVVKAISNVRRLTTPAPT